MLLLFQPRRLSLCLRLRGAQDQHFLDLGAGDSWSWCLRAEDVVQPEQEGQADQGVHHVGGGEGPGGGGQTAADSSELLQRPGPRHLEERDVAPAEPASQPAERDLQEQDGEIPK